MTTVDAVCLELVALPGGVFAMGADDRRRDERPTHQVELGSFRVAPRPVTNAEYERSVVEGATPTPPFWSEEGFRLPHAPVVGVSWHDAVAYCEWLSSVTGIECRLPTEAEREYAARGGAEGADWPEDDADWPSDEVRRAVATADRPHVPYDFCRNGFGLYCMADNVHEWCSDWYDRTYYERSPGANPIGPTEGIRRASRGGSWRHRVKFTRVSARSSLPPDYRYNDYGFRIYAGVD